MLAQHPTIPTLLARIPKGLEPLRRKFHEKNAATVATTFKGNAGFVAALEEVYEEFVTQNTATGSKRAALAGAA
ncbi:hypothetical protein B0H19DRAFT_1272191 [Mycena capillaripes]|nr:hypothetical protein B0H19DRAFT_1272191 [Mycena capillaripes]